MLETGKRGGWDGRCGKEENDEDDQCASTSRRLAAAMQQWEKRERVN